MVRFFSEEIKSDKIKMGLVNIDHKIDKFDIPEIKFDKIGDNLKWEFFFPVWTYEDEKFCQLQEYPEILMVRFENYGALDVVVAKISCKTDKEGVRNIF